MGGFCKYYKQMEQLSYDGGVTWDDTENYRRGDLYEPNSTDCGYVPIQYRWVVNTGGYACSGTTKMTQEKKQVSYDSGSTWTDVYPLETRIGSTVIQYNSSDCGCYERWITMSGSYLCSGTTKMAQEKKQVSCDNGSTWTDVYPLETRIGSTVIQYNSSDCGYVPPTPVFTGKWKLGLNDGSVVSAECDSSSTITYDEIAAYHYGATISAEIGNCVTNIDASAFWHFEGLTGITIPDSVTTIGGRAFLLCTDLSICTIGSGVTSIGAYAFRGCTSLTNVIFGRSVTSIGGYAFGSCSSLTSIVLPDSVTDIGEESFAGCSGVTTIIIGSGVTNIGNSAFSDCKNVKSITIYAAIPPTIVINSFFYTGRCPIYVPSASVNAYKSATNWSSYASRIQAIP